MNSQQLRASVERVWNDDVMPALMDFIRIPAISPLFDARWAENGHIEAAVDLAVAWCHAQSIRGLALEVVRLPGRTPLLFIEVVGDAPGTVMLYGHLDKQPEMVGWRDDLGPWRPVVEGDKLYGRGSVDDGYALFSALTALRALQEQDIPHARCVAIIECCEESGSYDLPHYIEHLAERIGTPDLVVGLDSGCGDYERLWCTVSLRGLVNGNLSVDVLTEGVHSGDASGTVPDSFRIARSLISRVEDENTGRVLPPAFHCAIPPGRREEARAAAAVLGDGVYGKFPFVPGMQPLARDPEALILNRAWAPALTVTGASGLPPVTNAGNVLRPGTALKLSLRIPPACEPHGAAAELKSLLESEPPYGARVSFQVEQEAPGWNAPPCAPWFEEALLRASETHFGHPAVFMGEGVTIPFMGMLGQRFPEAQLLITGVLGPGSNAHGPNEFLHLPAAKALTACVAEVIAAHGKKYG